MERHQIYVTGLHSAITTEKENTRRADRERGGGIGQIAYGKPCAGGDDQFELKAEILLS